MKQLLLRARAEWLEVVMRWHEGSALIASRLCDQAWAKYDAAKSERTRAWADLSRHKRQTELGILQ